MNQQGDEVITNSEDKYDIPLSQPDRLESELFVTFGRDLSMSEEKTTVAQIRINICKKKCNGRESDSGFADGK